MNIWDIFTGGKTGPAAAGGGAIPLLTQPIQPQIIPSSITNAVPRPQPRPVDLMTSRPPMPQARPTSAPQGQGFLSKLTSGDTMARLAMILDGMSMNPNQALQTVMQDKIARSQQDKASSRTAQWLRSLGTPQAMQAAGALESGAVDAQTAVAFAMKQQDRTKGIEVNGKIVNPETGEGIYEGNADRTVAWLRSLNTPQATQAAGALETGAIDAQTAVTMATKEADDGRTALMQNYEYALSQGMTEEQARAWASSAPTVNVGGKAETTFETESAKAQAGFFNTAMQAGMDARAQLGQIDVMESLISSGVGGTADAWKAWAQDSLGINVGAGGGVEALNATINQLVPAQRAPGSGSMSDRDVALFKSSLPALVNSPEGNRIIIATMRGMAEYKVAQGEIATAVAMGRMSREDGLAAMADLPDPMKSVMPIIKQLVPNASAPASSMSRDDAMRLLLQQP